MFKRLLLSLMIVACSVYGAEEVVVSKFTPEIQALLDTLEAAYNATKGDVAAMGQLCKEAVQEIRSVAGNENIELLKIAKEYDVVADYCERWLIFKNEEAARALYWANVRSFIWDMFNPYAYADAVKKTWQAGWGNMLNTLWTNHKSVLAGSALIATAAATGLFVAYKKGCFEQKKETENE